jgi:hypothetical protein
MKKKEQPITITHSEILSFALLYLGQQCQKLIADAKMIEEKNPDLAKAMREDNIYINKYKAAMQMYKLETGNDYTNEFGIE